MKKSTRAFTLLELVVVAGIATVLAMLLATATANSRPNVRVVQCLAHMKQLTASWTMYAHDYSDRVPNNFVITDTEYEIERRSYRTWACDVMSWDAEDSYGVTNTLLLQLSLLGPYINGDTTIFRCPSDNYLSSQQVAAGWKNRVRSVSMNVYFGPDRADGGNWPSGRSDWGASSNRQWLKIGEVPRPSQFFVLLDEDRDSIEDGSFFMLDPASVTSWIEYPASYQNGGCSISFVDGRAEVHKWLSNTTRVPARNQYPPVAFDQLGLVDYTWLTTRATVPY